MYVNLLLSSLTFTERKEKTNRENSMKHHGMPKAGLHFIQTNLWIVHERYRGRNQDNDFHGAALRFDFITSTRWAAQADTLQPPLFLSPSWETSNAITMCEYICCNNFEWEKVGENRKTKQNKTRHNAAPHRNMSYKHSLPAQFVRMNHFFSVSVSLAMIEIHFTKMTWFVVVR